MTIFNYKQNFVLTARIEYESVIYVMLIETILQVKTNEFEFHTIPPIKRITFSKLANIPSTLHPPSKDAFARVSTSDLFASITERTNMSGKMKKCVTELRRHSYITGV